MTTSGFRAGHFPQLRVQAQTRILTRSSTTAVPNSLQQYPPPHSISKSELTASLSLSITNNYVIFSPFHKFGLSQQKSGKSFTKMSKRQQRTGTVKVVINEGSMSSSTSFHDLIDGFLDKCSLDRKNQPWKSALIEISFENRRHETYTVENNFDQNSKILDVESGLKKEFDSEERFPASKNKDVTQMDMEHDDADTISVVTQKECDRKDDTDSDFETETFKHSKSVSKVISWNNKEVVDADTLVESELSDGQDGDGEDSDFEILTQPIRKNTEKCIIGSQVEMEIQRSQNCTEVIEVIDIQTQPILPKFVNANDRTKDNCNNQPQDRTRLPRMSKIQSTESPNPKHQPSAQGNSKNKPQKITTKKRSSSDPQEAGPSKKAKQSQSSVSSLLVPIPRPRPYECLQCHKRFYTRNHLTSHKTTHADDKERSTWVHECHICQKKFPLKYKLSQHLKRSHLVEFTPKPIIELSRYKYQCNHCDKKYTQRNSLYRHIKTNPTHNPSNPSESSGQI